MKILKKIADISIRKAVALGVILLLCSGIFSGQAYAEEETELKNSLTLENGAEGAEVSLFLVAEVSSDGYSYTFTEEYRNYSVSFEDLDTEGWLKAAGVLSDYSLRDNISPIRTGVIDKEGTVSFSDLSSGLYLVQVNTLIQDDTIYSYTPYLVQLPGIEDSEWKHDMVSELKGTSETLPETVNRKVVKIWEDEDQESDRPKEIVVQLLKDGVVADEKTLSDSNGWTAEWTDLDGNAVWSVVEKEVPSGYTVSSEQDKDTVLITNTRTPEEPTTPETPETPDTPDRLPVLGQIWWPVTLLAAAGVVLLIVGMFRKGKKDENE